MRLQPQLVPSATGSGAALALAAGAALDTHQDQPAALCPVSLVPYPNHPPAPFPHIIERGKPGIIGVLASGKRFCNEGLGYHDYVTALLAATPEGQEARSWLICDHRFLRRYGLGMVILLAVAVVPIWFWRNMAGLAYGISILLLVMVEIFGVVGMGAQRWIDLGFMRLQPSELMKITMVFDFEIEAVSLRSAWLISRACRPGS